MGKTIYVVTSGSYSSYKIKAVYDDKVLADKAVEMGYGEDVEEYELNEHADILRLGRANYEVGAWLGVGENYISAHLHSGASQPLVLKIHNHWRKGNAWRIEGVIEATGEEHAKKIVAEKIAQIRVEGGAPGVIVVHPHQTPTS